MSKVNLKKFYKVCFEPKTVTDTICTKNLLKQTHMIEYILGYNFYCFFLQEILLKFFGMKLF